MIDERHIELINKELDGLNTEAESKELELCFSENDEALKYYDELLLAAQALKRVEQVEPPSFLRTHILNSLQALPVPTSQGAKWIESVLNIFRQRPVARYALAFAGGVCATILLFLVTEPGHQQDMPDISRLSGSMMLPPEIARLPKVDSVSVDGSGFRAVFRTLKGNGTITVDCAIAATENVRLDLSGDPEELKFEGIQRLGGTDNDIMATGARVIFTGTKSEHSVITFTELADPRQPIEVHLYKGGTAIGNVTVRTN